MQGNREDDIISINDSSQSKIGIYLYCTLFILTSKHQIYDLLFLKE